MALFKGLRDRRLFRIVAAYAAGGWVVLEVVDQVTDQGVVPAFLYELTLIWCLVGLPAAVIVGWYHGEKGRQRATKVEVALLLAVAAMGAALSAGTVTDEIARRVRLEAAASGLEVRRVAVLYFQDLTRGGGLRHVADGFTEALIDQLAGVRGLDVISRNGVEPYRDAMVPRDSIGRLLGAGTLVDGHVEQTGDRLRVGLSLVDAQSGAEFRRASFEQPAGELIRAREAVVDQAARLLRQWLGEEVRLQRSRRATENVAAWALYQRGEKARKEAEAAARRHDAAGAEAAFERADSLLARVEVLDPGWAEPPTLRGLIGYRRARLLLHPRESVRWIERGLDHVGRALAIEPNHARALEVRGTLRYLHHLLGVVPAPERQQALLDDARADLERAVELDPSLASAHAILGHLYLRTHDLAAAVIADRRAYEEDAYLENADVVIYRNITGSQNLEQFTEARRWCEIGQRRFPMDQRFVDCELMLMTTQATEPDVARAWALRARIDSLVPAHGSEWWRVRGDLLVGGVLARAGLPDSARSVLLRARAQVTPQIDPDRWLYALEAYLRTLLGEEAEAIDLLERYVAINPGANLQGNWWWRPLRDHPRWRDLAAVTAQH